MDRCEKPKHTSTLIIAAIVILLCFASITGATLAIFTSSSEDGKIGINATSGNIEVDIINSSEDPSSIVGEVLKFTTSSGEIITDVLFEPGAFYYTEGFRVQNKGDIPINFILYVSEDKNNPDEARDFVSAFDVWLTRDPKDKSEKEKMQDFDGRLDPDKISDVYYLVFRMKETAGNEFQDRTFAGIGITVCAVQGNVNIK